MTQLTFAFLLTVFAGLATGIGGAIAFFTPRFDKKFLSFCLGFSAGVMIYVSFFELVPTGFQLLQNMHADRAEILYLCAFFGGIALTSGIDFMIPHVDNLSLLKKKHSTTHQISSKPVSKQLLRLGFVTALVLSIHNIPEGIATFFSALDKSEIAYVVAIAIAFHNIPEGFIVAIPIYYATSSRKKAFLCSFLSGLTEPLGAVIGYFFLASYLNDSLVGIILIGIAGIMIYISLDELLPMAHTYGKHHLTTLGLFFGMFLMAVSLICF